MFQKILALGAHPDDVEFGAGATIARFIEEKKEVFYVAFSRCEKSIPKGFPKDILEREMLNAAQELGIRKKNVTLFDFELRNFPQLRQDILETLVKLNKDLTPDLVLAPSFQDVHQDHETIARETFRAFKRMSSIWAYEIPWNTINLSRTLFVEVNSRHIKKKIAALERYESQKVRNASQFHNLSIADLVRVSARTVGVQGGLKYAEAFDCEKMMIRELL